MLEIRIYMDTPMRAVLDFKCCKIADQNLEIHLVNAGEEPITVLNHFDLENDRETYRVDWLWPPTEHPLEPGESSAVYCMMDEDVFAMFSRIVFYDTAGRAWRETIKSASVTL